MTSPNPTSDVLFYEEQQFRQAWIWLLFAGITVVVFLLVFRAHSWWLALVVLLLDAGILGFMYSLKLVTEVQSDGIHIRFFPLFRQTIPFDRISSFYARTYRPILEYGGWGVRFSWKGRAYNVRGNRGVQLVMTDGKRLLIGSQRADELEQALEAARDGGP